MDEEKRLVDYLYPLYRWKAIVLVCFLATVFGTVLYILLIPRDVPREELPTYEARAVVLEVIAPVGQASRLELLEQVSGQKLSKTPSGLSQDSGKSNLTLAIFQSRKFAGRVVDRMNFLELLDWGNTDIKQAQTEVAQFMLSSVALNENVLSARATDPVIAANIANTFLYEFSKYQEDHAVTTAKRVRIATEERLREITRQLEESQEALTAFQETHKSPTFRERLREEQLGGGLKLRRALYERLSGELESFRIEEQKEAPHITVLDYALPPKKPLPPSVGVFIQARSFVKQLVPVLLALLVGIALAYVLSYFEKEVKAPESSQKWAEMKQGLLADYRRVKAKVPFLNNKERRTQKERVK